MRKGIIFILCFLFFETTPQSQSLVNSGYSSFNKKDSLFFSKPRFLKTLGQFPTDLLEIYKTPFKGDNWLSLLAIAQGTAVLISQDVATTDWVKKASLSIGLHPETKYKSIVKLGKSDIIKIPLNLNSALYQLGEGGTSMMLAGGFWIYGKIKHNPRAEQTAYDLGEAFITMGITTQIFKRISGRESPSEATVNGGRWRPFPNFKTYQNKTSCYDAFPSGHLATMMATITVIKENYPEKKWISPLGYSLIGLTGWAMINNEAHWLSDYPLALAIGYVAGKLTTARHRNIQKKHTRTVRL